MIVKRVGGGKQRERERQRGGSEWVERMNEWIIDFYFDILVFYKDERQKEEMEELIWVVYFSSLSLFLRTMSLSNIICLK